MNEQEIREVIARLIQEAEQVDEASCAWCSEIAPLREWTHEGDEVEDLCPRCYRAAEEQRARERGV